MVSYLFITLLVILHCSGLSGCGIAVHNEITLRSLQNFLPKTFTEQKYKQDILESPGFVQAGSFFPDWGYQCLGYNQQSEDAHWPTFIKTAVNYIREVYPVSRFHHDKHVQGLISFVFAIMSHGMADVKWHSLSGLSDYFIIAMANSDFHGNTKEAHLAADAGAEFTLRHSNSLSYLNQTWQVPVKDIIEIYKRLYNNGSDKKVPANSHLKYCMATAFAASKIDVEFGKLMFGYYGSKSPFLTEEMYSYYRGGIEDMSASVTDCYVELVHAFEYGSIHTSPDTLCASYFYTTLPKSPCLKNPKSNYSHDLNQLIYKDYNPTTGVFTLTANIQSDRHYDTTLVPIVRSQTPESHEVTNSMQLRFQSPMSFRGNSNKECLTVGTEQGDITLTLPMSSGSLGHQLASGDFNANGQLDMAVSAPYHVHDILQQQTGSVFILNNTVITEKYSRHNDIRDLSTFTLQGSVRYGRFGWSMTTIDFNKDSVDDLAIATPFGKDNSGMIELYLGRVQLGLGNPNVYIQVQSRPFIPTVLAAIDVDQDDFKDLVVGCPLCPSMNQPQVGIVYIFISHRAGVTESRTITQPDISIQNPNLNSSSYDRFGESILVIKDTILIGSPGYSIESKQRVGRVYAFDLKTLELKWTITGTTQFQQYGKVLATDNNEIIAISSPSEENIIGLQKYWQGGSVRIYDWNKLKNNNIEVVPDIDMEHGMISVMQGRTSAGHLGQSLSVFKNNGELGIWARFGSQIGPLGTDAICITSQRYGQNARYSGAVTFFIQGN
ncbi:hypothetical protein INT48_008143 [Thamnidium elegans]|uniref:Phosphatidylinositol-glycan-specific phospholipase D n=1 Tax=Thamnidium elegans TaxID=101142 RepID=A0A8H7W2F2_9FUNG|nr:hypothetical protein INT48_008143 [Thamnidium elegans]